MPFEKPCNTSNSLFFAALASLAMLAMLAVLVVFHALLFSIW